MTTTRKSRSKALAVKAAAAFQTARKLAARYPEQAARYFALSDRYSAAALAY